MDAKEGKLLDLQNKINSLLNTARMMCPGTSAAERLERMSQEADGESKIIRRCRPTEKIEGASV